MSAIADWPWVTALGVVWLLSVTVVGVTGPFPLFDDWVYAETARTLRERGVLEFGAYAEVLMLPQFFWGLLFSLPAGFSHEALRISTLAAGYIASLAAMRSVRLAGAPAPVAFAAGLVLATTPVFMVLSFSFMSDIPTVALIAVSLAFFAKWVQTGEDRWFWASLAVAVLACLNRITSVTVVAALLLGRFAAAPSWPRLRQVFIAGGVAALVLIAVQQVLLQTVGLPGYYHFRAERSVSVLQRLLSPEVMVQVAWAFTRAWIHLGLMALPFLLICHVRTGLTSIAVGIALSGVLVAWQKRLPLVGNIFYEGGTGPVLVAGRDAYSLGEPFWLVVTAGAVVGAALLADTALRVTLRALRGRGERATPGLVLQVAALSTIVALLAGHAIYNVFDRYLLMAMPSVLLMAAVERGAKPATWSDAPGWGAAIVVGLFAVVSTRDSMQWQRARWDLLDRVAAAGISSDVLDGGEEFNAVARGHSGAPDALYELRLVSDGENEPFCARPDIWLGPRAKAICLLKKDGVPAR